MEHAFQSLWSSFGDLITDAPFMSLCIVALITGIVRGFAGFGTGMLFLPAATIILPPKMAVAIIWILDSLPALAIAIPALKFVQWKSVLPAAIGFGMTVGLGAKILATTDPTLLRWGISFLVIACVILLASGWSYRGPRSVFITVGVGGVCGITGGAASIPIPPILAYWLALDQRPRITRANIIIFMIVTECAAGVAFFLQDIFTARSVAGGIILTPVYFAGLMIGSYLFNDAKQETYKKVALIIITISAVLGLPVLDMIWR